MVTFFFCRVYRNGPVQPDRDADLGPEAHPSDPDGVTHQPGE